MSRLPPSWTGVFPSPLHKTPTPHATDNNDAVIDKNITIQETDSKKDQKPDKNPNLTPKTDSKNSPDRKKLTLETLNGKKSTDRKKPLTRKKKDVPLDKNQPKLTDIVSFWKSKDTAARINNTLDKNQCKPDNHLTTKTRPDDKKKPHAESDTAASKKRVKTRIEEIKKKFTLTDNTSQRVPLTVALTDRQEIKFPHTDSPDSKKRKFRQELKCELESERLDKLKSPRTDGAGKWCPRGQDDRPHTGLFNPISV